MKTTKRDSKQPLVLPPGEAQLPATIGSKTIVPPATKPELIEAMTLRIYRQCQELQGTLNSSMKVLLESEKQLKACLIFETFGLAAQSKAKLEDFVDSENHRWSNKSEKLWVNDVKWEGDDQSDRKKIKSVQFCIETNVDQKGQAFKAWKSSIDAIDRANDLYRNGLRSVLAGVLGEDRIDQYCGRIRDIPMVSEIRTAIKSKISCINTDARVERLLSDRESVGVLDDMIAKLNKSSNGLSLKEGAIES